MFDYVVLGAGSAGCAVAGLLSEDPKVRVLLLEAGPPPRNPWIRVPAGLPRVLATGKYNWNMMSEPSKCANGRVEPIFHGKTLGGGSAINGMIYMRSYPDAYGAWREFGVEGWDWPDVLEAFRRIEGHEDGASAMHGGDGPLRISKLSYHHPSVAAFVKAGAALGARETTDLNDGESADSVGLVQLSVDRGRRCSSYEAFVRPHLKRPNLEVVTNALVRRVVVEDGRAVGAEYEIDGEIKIARAQREVIVSCGAINSPHVLLLSGIGPADELQKHGVPVMCDLPAVGRNLQDHALVWSTAQTSRSGSMNRDLEGLPVLLQGMRYLMTRKGPIATGGSQAVAMIRSQPDLPHPDVEICFRPFTVMANKHGVMITNPDNSISAYSCLLQPKSRGSIRLRSADPRERPAMDSNYLSAPEDVETLLFGLRWIQRSYQSSPLKEIVRGLEPEPQADDSALRDYIRDTVMSGGTHAAGTCAMGRKGPDAVVDERLRVHGIAGLRVADASVMPRVSAGNTNAPSIMIGARAADFIRADWRN